MTARIAATSTVALVMASAASAHAAECRSLSGEVLNAAQTRAYSLGVKGCAPPAQAPPAGRPALSPLLRLYENPRASVDVAPHAAPRVTGRSVVWIPGAPAPARRGRRGPTTPAYAAPPYAAPPYAAPGPDRGARNRAVVRAAVDGRAFLAVARAYDIDPAFLASVVRQESGGRAGAVSVKGARGLMQVMPGTAARLGVDHRRLADPVVNLATGAFYLKTLQRRYGNNLPLVLAAYNAGEGAVDRHGRRVPPYRETRGYVTTILGGYRSALQGGRGPVVR